MLNLEEYIPIMKFLSLYLGTDCEIILCNTEKILHIENAFDDSQKSGNPIGEMQQAFVSDSKCHTLPYTVNYRAMTSSKEKLRSATLFIKDEETKKLKGLLTINMKVTALLQTREILETLINGAPSHHAPSVPALQGKPPEYYETLSLSVSELIDSVIDESCVRFGATPERFTAAEKLSIVREMDKRGVFLVKGSISEVAKQLKSSDATIYRYLQQINK